jgi:hypothetical protein
MNASLWKRDANGDWSAVDRGEASGYSLQSIYGAAGTLFAGGRKGSSWAVFYDNSGSLAKLIEPAGMLTGAAAYDTNQFFIATQGGIYQWDGTTVPIDLITNPAVVGSTSHGAVNGIININNADWTERVTDDVVVAVTENGSVLRYDDDNEYKFVVAATADSALTGGMSVWMEFDQTIPDTEPDEKRFKPSLLLLGVQSSDSYNRGYREIKLDDPSGNIGLVYLGSPGTATPSSVAKSNRSKYEASLAKHSVTSIVQVPLTVDSLGAPPARQPIIFASTINSGLQSLEDGLWNAEE